MAQNMTHLEKKFTVSSPQPVPQNAIKLYRDMLLIRRFEERAGQLYGMGEISGFCHLYIGQEAVAVGVQSMVAPQDTLITAYRDHGHMLACGMDPKGVMAELTGRSSGYSKGKGGSMHMFSRRKNFFGGHGIVGAQIPIGTGMAFAHTYNQDDGICFAFMGDGAINQGQVYESFNMAALWKLPIVYIVENNGYAMGTAANKGCARSQELHRRGEGFGIPGIKVDGMDVFQVHEAIKGVVEWVRSSQKNQGPFMVEMETYRYRGHSMSDPGQYRTKDEVAHMKENNDPLLRCKDRLLKNNLATEKELKDIDQEIKKIMMDVVAFSQKSPEPSPEELYTDIYL